VTRPVQAYERLYKVRNQSLHGGAISKRLIVNRWAEAQDDVLELPALRLSEWNHLMVAVPALYRGVLLQLLTEAGFHTQPAEPPGEDLDQYRDYLHARDRYQHYEKPLFGRCRPR
jgi:hypothetical protein